MQSSAAGRADRERRLTRGPCLCFRSCRTPAPGASVAPRPARLVSFVEPVQVGRSASCLEELTRCGKSIIFGHQRPARELRVPLLERIYDLALVVLAVTATGRTGQSVVVDERGLVVPKPDRQLWRQHRPPGWRRSPRSAAPVGPELTVEPSKLGEQLFLEGGDHVLPPHRPRHLPYEC